MLESAHLTEVGQAYVALYWGIRGLADDPERLIPLDAMLRYLAMSDQERFELAVLRKLDSEFVTYVRELSPRRRESLAKLKLVKKPEPIVDDEEPDA